MATQQPNYLAEGTWPCTVLSAGAGEDQDKPGVLKVRINVRFDDGPSKGRTATYEDEINARSAIYVKRSMKAVGWTGGKSGADATSLAEDVQKWIEQTGGKTTAEVRHVEIKKGKKYDAWRDAGCEGPPPIWDKVNAIGRGPKPLAAPKAETLSDAEEALRKAMADDGDTDGAPQDSDDIPF